MSYTKSNIKTIIFLLFIPIITFAHPHVFADVALKIEVKNKQVDAVQISWHYDEMTSAMLSLSAILATI